MSLFNKRFMKYGLPFLLCVVGGSFGLKHFAQLRYTFSKQSTVTREDLKKTGLPMKKPEEITLEKVYERVQTLDIDNWEQVRGPRPWEENAESN